MYYIAFNRAFPTYADAVKYCIENDFDPEYIEEVKEP